MGCIFCQIVNGELPAHLLWEDQTTLAFLDINPAADGHVLVIPRSHASDIWDIDAETMADVARTTHRMAALLEHHLKPAGMTLFQANRSAGWQDVFHLHVHLIPRAPGDDLVRPWEAVPDRRDRLAEVFALLRSETSSDLARSAPCQSVRLTDLADGDPIDLDRHPPL